MNIPSTYAIVAGTLSIIAVASIIAARKPTHEQNVGTEKALQDAAEREQRRVDNTRLLEQQKQQRKAAEAAVRADKEARRIAREAKRPPL